MRASWSGALQAALLVVPVKMYGATKEHDTRFRNLCPCHGQPIKMPKVCSVTMGQLPSGTLLRGVEISKPGKTTPGQYAVVSDAEVEALPLPTTGAIVLDGFADRASIPALLREKTVYLGPESAAVARPYALLRAALLATGQVGIGKVGMRGKEHLVAVDVDGPALTLSHLFYADELADAQEIPDLPGLDVQPKAAELALARQVIEALALQTALSEFRDDAQDALEALVLAKAAGQAPTLAQARPVVEPPDIMDALRASLEAARSGRGGQVVPLRRTSKAVAG